MKYFYLSFILLLLSSCADVEPPRTSRHSKFCSCEFEHDGDRFKGSLASLDVEQQFDKILLNVGVNPKYFHLCQSLKDNLGKVVAYASQYQGTPFVMLDYEDFKTVNPVFRDMILVHETSHLLMHHIYVPSDDYNNSKYNQELDAWNFVGFYLAEHSSYSIDEILKNAPFTFETALVPSRRAIKDAITEGYRRYKISKAEYIHIDNKIEDIELIGKPTIIKNTDGHTITIQKILRK